MPPGLVAAELDGKQLIVLTTAMYSCYTCVDSVAGATNLLAAVVAIFPYLRGVS